MIFYLAILPLYLDPDGPMYPPVVAEDRFIFGPQCRAVTVRNMNATYRAWRNLEDLDPVLMHLDLVRYAETKAYMRWLYMIYDDIDSLAMLDEFEQKGWEFGYERCRIVLIRLRQNLGPINYYRGIVPQIPQEVWR